MNHQTLNQKRSSHQPHEAQNRVTTSRLSLGRRCVAASLCTARKLWKWLNSPPQPRIAELTALQGQAHLSPYVRMRLDTHV